MLYPAELPGLNALSRPRVAGRTRALTAGKAIAWIFAPRTDFANGYGASPSRPTFCLVSYAQGSVSPRRPSAAAARRLEPCRSSRSTSGSTSPSPTVGSSGSPDWICPDRSAAILRPRGPRATFLPVALSEAKRNSISLPTAPTVGTARWPTSRLLKPQAIRPGRCASALLRAGYARVRPEFETRSCAAERLALEDRARRAALGMWRDPEYAVIQSFDMATLRRRDGQFVVIEGRVRRVGFGRSRLYLDLAPYDGPTIVVARKLETAFAKAGRPLDTLAGQTIRARGVLDARFGPRLEVGEPAMIEILRRSDAQGVDKPRP